VLDVAHAAGFRMLTAVGVKSEAQLSFAGLHQILLDAAVLRRADEPATRMTIRGPGIGITRIPDKAQQASRMVSSWISIAISAKADEYCLLWCAQNSNSRRPGSRTRT